MIRFPSALSRLTAKAAAHERASSKASQSAIIAKVKGKGLRIGTADALANKQSRDVTHKAQVAMPDAVKTVAGTVTHSSGEMGGEATEALHTRLKRRETVTHNTVPAVTHKVNSGVTHRTNADRQREYRNAHTDEVKEKNRLRMATKRAKTPE